MTTFAGTDKNVFGSIALPTWATEVHCRKTALQEALSETKLHAHFHRTERCPVQRVLKPEETILKKNNKCSLYVNLETNQWKHSPCKVLDTVLFEDITSGRVVSMQHSKSHLRTKRTRPKTFSSDTVFANLVSSPLAWKAAISTKISHNCNSQCNGCHIRLAKDTINDRQV